MASERYTKLQSVRLDWLYNRTEQLQTFLATSEPIASISADGVSATFDRRQALEELDRCLAEIRKIEGTRPVCLAMEFNE